MYGVVDGQYAGFKLVCSRPAEVTIEIVVVLFATPLSLYANMLTIEEVAVNSGAKNEVSWSTRVGSPL